MFHHRPSVAKPTDATTAATTDGNGNGNGQQVVANGAPSTIVASSSSTTSSNGVAVSVKRPVASAAVPVPVPVPIIGAATVRPSVALPTGGVPSSSLNQAGSIPRATVVSSVPAPRPQLAPVSSSAATTATTATNGGTRASVAVTSTTSAIDALRMELSKTTDNVVRNELLMKLIEVAKPIQLIGKLPSAQLQPLLKCLRLLSVDKEQAIRSQAYRVLRYLVTDDIVIKEMVTLNMDVFIARSLERDSKYLWERMQALKLIRKIMQVQPLMVPRTIVQSLVSIAEHAKDDFRRVCLDALRELVLMNPEIVASCNGIRTIVDSILDPTCQDIAAALTLTLLFLLDQESSRRHLRPQLDLLKLLSVFTDTQTPNSPEKESRRAAAHKALVTIMRSWTGILCLTSDYQGLRSLIQLLGLPPSVKGASWAREAIFELLFEIMHVVKSSDLHTAKARNSWKHLGPNLLHNYIVMVLIAFIDCGLIEILTKLGMSADTEFSGVATNLLTEMLVLSSGLLPRSVCAKLNALASVVSHASAFGGDVSTTSRVRALNMLMGLSRPKSEAAAPAYLTETAAAAGTLNISGSRDHTPSESYIGRGESRGNVPRRDSTGGDSSPRGRGIGLRQNGGKGAAVHGIKVDRMILSTDVPTSDDQQRPLEMGSGSISNGTPSGANGNSNGNGNGVDGINSNGTSARSTARMLTFLRHHIDAHTDERDLDMLIRKSQVTNGKDYKLWDFNLCVTLLEGPLTTQAGLQAALKTKLLKRLLSFLKPSKRFFSDLDWNVPNNKFVRVACRLFRLLLSLPEGRDYPFFHELVDEIFVALLSEAGKEPTSLPPTPRGARAPTGFPTKEPESPQDPKRSVGILSSLTGGSSTPTPKAPKISKQIEYKFRCLSRNHVAKKLSREYFTLLGILSSSSHGQMFFDKFDFFEQLRDIGRDSSKDFFTRLLIQHLDLSSSVVQKFVDRLLNEASTPLRLFAISHLRVYLRGLSNTDDFVWAINILNNQLLVEPRDVALTSLSVLEEACAASVACLEELIKRRPSFKLVGEAAHNLQLAFLSCRAGVEYLQSARWIEPQLRYWRAGGGNQRYVESLENALVAALSAGTGGTPETSGGSGSNGVGGASMSMPAGSSMSGGTGPVGAATATGRAGAGAQLIRTEADDYYFKRLHALPWTVEVNMEYSSRNIQLLCETFVHTGPQHPDEIREQAAAAGIPPTDDDGDSNASQATYVVALLCEADGRAKPYKIDGGVTMRARLSVGSGPGSDTVNDSMSLATPSLAPSTSSRPSIAPHRAPSTFLSRSPTSPRPTDITTRTLPIEDKDNGPSQNSFFSSDRTQSEQVCRPDNRTCLSEGKCSVVLGDNMRWNFVFSDGRDNGLFLESIWFRLPSSAAAVAAVSVGPHMYGELAKTDDGCNLIRASGHLREFVDTIKGIGALGTSASSLQKRAALWAVGHIGSSPLGFALLEESGDIVPFISEQAHHCPTLSMRGTCFYILGLLSRTSRARITLARLGWQFCPHPLAGIVVPLAVNDFLAIPQTPYAGSWAMDRNNPFGISRVPGTKGKKDDEFGGDEKGGAAAGGAGAATGAQANHDSKDGKAEAKENPATLILGHISNLCNHVTQKTSLQALRALRTSHKEYFSSAALLMETCKLLASYTYRLPARRFILFDLFNIVDFNATSMNVFDQRFNTDTNEEQVARVITPLVKGPPPSG